MEKGVRGVETQRQPEMDEFIFLLETTGCVPDRRENADIPGEITGLVLGEARPRPGLVRRCLPSTFLWQVGGSAAHASRTGKPFCFGSMEGFCFRSLHKAVKYRGWKRVLGLHLPLEGGGCEFGVPFSGEPEPVCIWLGIWSVSWTLI